MAIDSNSRAPGYGQGELVVAISDALVPTLDAQPADVGVAVTGLQEQALHLYEVTTRFDQAVLDQIRIWAMNSRTYARDVTGATNQKREAILRQSQIGAVKNLADAAIAFQKAFGMTTLADSGLQTPQEARIENDQAYVEFQAVYRGKTDERALKRQAFRDRLLGRLNHQQGVFAEIEVGEVEVSRRLVNLAAPNALSRALRPDYLEKPAGYYDDIDPALMREMHPERLAILLQGRGQKQRNVMKYPLDDTSRRNRYVTVTPDDWKDLPRYSAALATSAYDAAESAQHVGKVPIDDDAPRRASLHSVEAHISTSRRRLENVLVPSLSLIHRFQEAARFNGGLQRFGDEGNMRIHLQFLFDYVLTDMLWALKAQQGWSRDEMQMRQRAVEKAILMQDRSGVRLKNFSLLLGVMEMWYESKANLYQSKIAQANRYVHLNQTNEERAEKAS